MSTEEHDVAEALKAAGSATVTWQLNRKGLWRSWMKGPKPLSGHPRACGPAFTLAFVPAREDLATPESYTVEGSLRDSLEQVPEGAVVVCDGRGNQDMGRANVSRAGPQAVDHQSPNSLGSSAMSSMLRQASAAIAARSLQGSAV